MKKKPSTSFAQENIKEELIEDKLDQVAGGARAKIESIPEPQQGIVEDVYAGKIRLDQILS